MVFQSSFKAQARYFLEIVRYDKKRGYFAVALLVRCLLAGLQFAYFLPMMLKDVIGKKDWVLRRQVVETIAAVKVAIPLVLLWVMLYAGMGKIHIYAKRGIAGIVLYVMSGTLVYLLTLIMFADIQRPSANIIRSLIMLFVNYIEVSFDIAVLFYMNYWNSVSVMDAFAYGVLGRWPTSASMMTGVDFCFAYADAGIKFFFASLVFGYLTNHMKQRKFRS